MQYFIKDNKLHRYPVPKRCGIQFHKEILRDTIPHNVEQCIYCMRWWPEDDNNDEPENGSSQNTEQRSNREIMMLQKQMA